jgi:hypothetical protein
MKNKKVVYVEPYQRGLVYIDEDPKECDFCDNKKICATINTINLDAMCVCEDCLKAFVKTFKK